ncbi:N-acetylglucosamine-6-phosphate deacetylase [Gluconacetobacter sp. SXCC-1]|uniref:Amidohydrolase family protein n=1 Tax=Komagataeibacter rhaeticus TaxID=215221 RepID=A0A181CAG5_9PROT|nr:amidohydrolase family protein [Komagataeibacter rhaeticus]ATU72950.1 N-acetylglucosamine-6-phosphate deacetylase [Komagataeibacter xylinus]EGG77285.1 N-acetylglucosamine-6-phosphate deacetylase [Gluconacetobacter sp. SXCC-1]QIP35301.1 amidohydrolase family protein [Komagataeibacter rhaeticus]QOC47865.1 amidohydrolase family protein [Komagataeibacter rhaeticus]WPP22755.1 amidohydrolase family protein [Komagataeibacter rhaeticus]
MNIDGHLVLPDRVMPGRIMFDQMIADVRPLSHVPDRYILPGFIDGHVHGGGGADTMDGVDAIRHMALFHMAQGTTTLLPTTMTAPWSDIMDALYAVADVMRTGIHGGPSIPGAHLEGPFINPHRLGAQPPFTQVPGPARMTAVLRSGAVRVVTLAPEIEHADAAIQAFVNAGIRVNIGHTLADHDQTERAICLVCGPGGTVGGTHLFNAMPPIAARAPGPATALMCSDAAYAEMVFDTHHVHPALFRLAHRVMGGRLVFVTDSMRATGAGDGPSTLGGQEVMVADGVARLADGTLAGSVLTLDQALRNALQAGVSLPQAAALVSTHAANWLGLHDRGALLPGRRADMVVLGPDLTVQEVWVEGRRRA